MNFQIKALLLAVIAAVVKGHWQQGVQNQQQQPLGPGWQRPNGPSRPIPLADLFPDFFSFNTKTQAQTISSSNSNNRPAAEPLQQTAPPPPPQPSSNTVNKPPFWSNNAFFNGASDYSFKVIPMGRAVEQPKVDGSGPLKFDTQNQQLQWRQPQLTQPQQIFGGNNRRIANSNNPQLMQDRFQGDTNSFLRTFQNPIRERLSGMADLAMYPTQQRQPSRQTPSNFGVVNDTLPDFNQFPLSNSLVFGQFDKDKEDDKVEQKASSPKPPSNNDRSYQIIPMGPMGPLVGDTSFMSQFRFPAQEYFGKPKLVAQLQPAQKQTTTTMAPLIVPLEQVETTTASPEEELEKRLVDFQQQFMPGRGLPILQVGKDGNPINLAQPSAATILPVAQYQQRPAELIGRLMSTQKPPFISDEAIMATFTGNNGGYQNNFRFPQPISVVPSRQVPTPTAPSQLQIERQQELENFLVQYLSKLQQQGQQEPPPRGQGLKIVEVGPDGMPLDGFWNAPQQPKSDFAFGAPFFQQGFRPQTLPPPVPATSTPAPTTTTPKPQPQVPLPQHPMIPPWLPPFFSFFPTPMGSRSAPLYQYQQLPVFPGNYQQLPDFSFLGGAMQQPPVPEKKVPMGEWFPPLNSIAGQARHK